MAWFSGLGTPYFAPVWPLESIFSHGGLEGRGRTWARGPLLLRAAAGSESGGWGHGLQLDATDGGIALGRGRVGGRCEGRCPQSWCLVGADCFSGCY